MVRQITNFGVTNEDRRLVVEAVDDVEYGANHIYLIRPPINDGGLLDGQLIHFQKGPIKEVGINGITELHLLVILRDRLEAFQEKFPSSFNKAALVMALSGVCGYTVGYFSGYGDAFRYMLEKNDDVHLSSNKSKWIQLK